MTSTCPDLHTSIAGQCFQVVLESLPWAQAQQECQDRGGRLAEPKEIRKFFEYMSDITESWETYWVGAIKDKYGYWKWSATKTNVNQRWWVETHTEAFLNPISCAYVLPGYYKSGLHGGPCNETKRYVCEGFVKSIPSPPKVASPTVAPITAVPYTSVVTVAGVLAVLLLMLIIFIITRKRLGFSKINIQPDVKGEKAATIGEPDIIAIDKSRLANVIFIGDKPIHSDLVVDHPSGSPMKQFNVNIEDKADGPDIKALLECHREITEEDKLSVSDHLGLKWCEVGRRMKLSDGQIENIRADHPRSIDRAYELLTIWHDRESQNAKVAKLANILLECKAMSALSNLNV